MDTLVQDLRHALRSLRRSPGFVTVALLSLALGIGVNIVFFALLNATLLRPLPYPHADRLVDVHEDNPKELCEGCAVGTSYPTYEDWRARAHSFSNMGAYLERAFSLAEGEYPLRVTGALISASLFPTLGVGPQRGSLFVPEHDRVGGAPVVLLGHELWERQFASDPAVIGRTIRVNGVPRTVVGIMPPRFRFPEFAELWVPMAPELATMARDDRSVGVVARLAEGVTMAQADGEMAAIARGLAEERPDVFSGWIAGVMGLREDLSSDSAPPFLILLAGAVCVLLIACANLANLQLVRATQREREFAVRTALGAPRSRLTRLLLVESLVLSLSGTAVAMLAALWGIDLAVAMIPSDIPFWVDVRIDWRVWAFALLMALTTAMLFGLAPMLRMSRGRWQEQLKETPRGSTSSANRGRLRHALAALQIALALVLVAVGGLLLKTLLTMQPTADQEPDARQTLVASAELLDERYANSQQVVGFANGVLERVQQAPGVSAAAVEGFRFIGSFVGDRSILTLEGETEPLPRSMTPSFATAVSPAYFHLMRLPILRGRGIAPTDHAGGPAVAVVSRNVAETFWPGSDPLGKQLHMGGPVDRTLTVVGIASDRINHINGMPIRALYTAFAQDPQRTLSVFVRTTGAPMAFAPALRLAVRDVDPDLPLTSVESVEQRMHNSTAFVRFFLWLIGAMAVLALALATLGIYGVVSFAVAQRTQEIGIRIALGASAGRVLHLVLRHALLMSAVGVVIGLGAALASTQLLRSILVRTSPTDPVVLGTTSLVLMAVALLASAIPARRALRVNPVDALRTE